MLTVRHVHPCATASSTINVTVSRRIKRWLVLITGWGFIALGVVGLFLPILQGVLFLLIGLTILSAEYAWARKLLRKLRERFPSLTTRLEVAKLRASTWLRRLFSSKPDGV